MGAARDLMDVSPRPLRALSPLAVLGLVLLLAPGCTCSKGTPEEPVSRAQAATPASAAPRVVDPAASRDSLLAVWGSANDDVWAVGDRGAITHFDGKAWTAVASGTEVNLSAVAGTGAKDVWATGEEGVTLHYDGKAWKEVSREPGASLLGVWASGPSDVWVAGV